jgi:hypothetical protein
MDFSAARVAEWRADCMERNLRIRVYLAVALAKRVSLRRRDERISAAAPKLAE